MHVMPRSESYLKLYPNATIINCHTRFHNLIVKTLLQVFLYYRRKDWKGSLGRISSAMSITNITTDTFDEIASISKEMDAETMLQLHNEARKAHEKTEHIKEKVDRAEIVRQQIAAQVTEMRGQLSVALGENVELKKQLNGTYKLRD